MNDRVTPSRRLADRCRSHPAWLAVALSLLAGACAPGSFEARPVSHGFGSVSGVMNPYEDGKLHLSEGRSGLAIERFRQALAQDRGSIDALNGLAVAYAGLGRTALAETYLQRALDLHHDDVATLNNYGRLLIEQGRWQQARVMLALAERSAGGPESVVVQANLAAIETPRPPRPYRTAEPASPLRLAKTDTATYRLEIGTAVLPEIASIAPTSPSIQPPWLTPAGLPAIAAATRVPAVVAAFATEPTAQAGPAASAFAAAPLTPVSATPAATAAVRTALPDPQPPTSGRLDAFIVVANGVGRTGLAAEWRGRLGRDGIAVGSLANALPFQTARTEIRYHPFFAREAYALAALLPSSATLIADRDALGDIYVELGRDSLEPIGVDL